MHPLYVFQHPLTNITITIIQSNPMFFRARFGKGLLSLPPSHFNKKPTPVAKPKKNNNDNNNNGSHQDGEEDSDYEEELSAGGTTAAKKRGKGILKAGATRKKKLPPPQPHQLGSSLISIFPFAMLPPLKDHSARFISCPLLSQSLSLARFLSLLIIHLHQRINHHPSSPHPTHHIKHIYSAGRDRRPGGLGGGGGGKAFHRTGSAAGGGGRSGRAPYDDPYGYVGRRVWRLWPEENPPWVEGYVTAYDPTSDSHTILYDPNTGEQETSEAFSFTIANPAEYVLDEMVHLQTMVGSRRQRDRPVPLEPVAPPPPGGYPVVGAAGGYGGGAVGYGGGLGGAPSLKRRKSAAAPVPPYAPFDATYLASRLEVAQEDELTQMLVILQRREEEVGNEIVQLEDAILHGADLEKRAELEKQFEELCKREREVMAELKKLREEPEA